MEKRVPEFPGWLEYIRPIGRGTMADVFLARERELGRLVAVKVLRFASDETARARFVREARSAASLSHPHVLPVHRFGRLADGTPYLVMPYVKGRTLAERLRAEGRLPVAEARRMFCDLASALVAAHHHGIVHRDVRPDNVLLEQDTGRVLLSDFGIAAVLDIPPEESGHLTATGQIMGIPRYASPEQLTGAPVTEQADVYSLALTAYEALAGRGPFTTDSPGNWVVAQLEQEPAPLRDLRPAVEPKLADLIHRCLSKKPSHRPAAADIVRRLEAPAAGSGDASGPDRGLPGAVADIRRRRFIQFLIPAVGVGWVLIEAVLVFVERGSLPDEAFGIAFATAIAGVLAAAVTAWFHGERGRQKIPPAEIFFLGLIAAGWLISIAALALIWS